MPFGKPLTIDKKAEGIANLIYNARETFENELTEDIINEWHYKLTEHGHSIKNVGRYRDCPIYVVSGGGGIGKEKIQFEAPPSEKLRGEMKKFIKWFNSNKPENPILRASIVHHYFVSIHPYEDGNGRIARALTEKALSQGLKQPIILSLSETISRNKKYYYEAIRKSQKNNDITHWVKYFSKIVLEAHRRTEKQIQFTIDKARFFQFFENKLNDRQLLVIRRLLQATDNAERGLSNKRYQKLAKTNKSTATRDLADLVKKGIIIKNDKGGRSVSYSFNMPSINNNPITWDNEGVE